MRKVMALFMAMFMFLSVTAFGADISFLKEPYKNYALEGNFKIKFDENGNFEKLLDEMGAEEESGEVFELVPFIKSLLSFDATGETRINMSDDFKKIEAGFTFDTSQYISVNPNLNADVRTKSEVWLKMDLSDSENPVYNMVIASPFMKKYMVIDLFELIDVEEKEAFLTAMNMTMNEEFIYGQNEFLIKTIEKNANVTSTKNKCVITIDNKALISIVKDILLNSMEMMKNGYLPENAAEDFKEIKERFTDLDLSDVQILGSDGIVITYGLKNGKISSVDVSADISINIEKLYTEISGMDWEYTSEGLLEFDVKISEKVVASNGVVIEFPELTEENSVLLHEKYAGSDYEEEFPRYGVYAVCDYLPVIDGEVYVPLRLTINEAYEDTAAISYDNGTITLTSENFKDFSTLTLKVGSDKAVSDTGEYTIKPPIIKDDVSYVASSFFEDVFRWEYGSARQDLLKNQYNYSFYTYTYDEEDDTPVEYPNVYVYGNTDNIKNVDGEIYFPLREVFENAYEESVSVNFENGVIKLESEFFPGFKTLTITNGSDKVYAGDTEYSVGKVFIKSGITYVNKKLFEDVFGWELTDLRYFIDQNYWMYEFITLNE